MNIKSVFIGSVISNQTQKSSSLENFPRTSNSHFKWKVKESSKQEFFSVCRSVQTSICLASDWKKKVFSSTQKHANQIKFIRACFSTQIKCVHNKNIFLRRSKKMSEHFRKHFCIGLIVIRPEGISQTRFKSHPGSNPRQITGFCNFLWSLLGMTLKARKLSWAAFNANEIFVDEKK